jgi:hypothetical protein
MTLGDQTAAGRNANFMPAEPSTPKLTFVAEPDPTPPMTLGDQTAAGRNANFMPAEPSTPKLTFVEPSRQVIHDRQIDRDGSGGSYTTTPIVSPPMTFSAIPTSTPSSSTISGGYIAPASDTYGSMVGLSSSSMAVESQQQTSDRIASLEKFANDDPDGFAATFVP